VELYSVTGDVVGLMSPTSFAAEHLEDQIQSWADSQPAFINAGQPMLSLGREILTQHGHAIDNMFIDGDGVLVAAEMKRAKSPRDVVAQMLDYAAFVSRMGWEDVERYCLKRQGSDLATCFFKTFGRSCIKDPKPRHRLAIVAESFDPRARDAAVYLIDKGIPLVLVEFHLFQIGDQSLLQVRTVLGDIPRQSQGPASTPTIAAGAPDDGYAAWLLASIGKQLPEIGEAQGWPLRHRVNQQSLPFNSAEWPVPLRDCHFRVDLYNRNSVSLRFSFRQPQAPHLLELLQAREADWKPSFPATLRLADETPYATLTFDRPRPEMANTTQAAEVVTDVARMTGVLRPIIDEYFASTAPRSASS
jgi:hypothetical protein